MPTLPPNAPAREPRGPDAVELVLFDLDGTLADTAPDLARAINGCLQSRGMAPRPIEELRPWASHGARGLIGCAFGLGPEAPGYEALRSEFVERYEADLCHDTTLFAGVAPMLARLEQGGKRWGIVTNKVARLTTPLVRALGLDRRAACVVSGDTAARAKPDPAPIHWAMDHCQAPAARAIYVGDDRRDIEAGRAAGVATVAVAYGYSAARDNILDWQADLVIAHPGELLDWLFGPGTAPE